MLFAYVACSDNENSISGSLDTTSESESIEQPESETSTSDDSSGGLNSDENGGNWTGGAPLS